MPQNRFARKRRSIEPAVAVLHDTVDRHLLTGPYEQKTSDFDILGIDFLYITVISYQISGFGSDIHKRRYRLTGLSDRIALEQLADLEKQHYRYCFLKFTGGISSDARDDHQEILVKYLTVRDVLRSLQ